jgi:hypothetical protein
VGGAMSVGVVQYMRNWLNLWEIYIFSTHSLTLLRYFGPPNTLKLAATHKRRGLLGSLGDNFCLSLSKHVAVCLTKRAASSETTTVVGALLRAANRRLLFFSDSTLQARNLGELRSAHLQLVAAIPSCLFFRPNNTCRMAVTGLCKLLSCTAQIATEDSICLRDLIVYLSPCGIFRCDMTQESQYIACCNFQKIDIYSTQIV